jgi:hypothetical protein
MVGGLTVSVGASQNIIATITGGGFIDSGAVLDVGICYESGTAAPVLIGEAMPWDTPSGDAPITVSAAGAVPQGTYTVGLCAEQSGGSAGVLWEAVISGWVIVSN